MADINLNPSGIKQLDLPPFDFEKEEVHLVIETIEHGHNSGVLPFCPFPLSRSLLLLRSTFSSLSFSCASRALINMNTGRLYMLALEARQAQERLDLLTRHAKQAKNEHERNLMQDEFGHRYMYNIFARVIT